MSVPSETAEEFDQIAQAEGRGKSELICEMLHVYRDYLEIGTFASLQSYGASRAHELGIGDEQDVERLITEARGL